MCNNEECTAKHEFMQWRQRYFPHSYAPSIHNELELTLLKAVTHYMIFGCRRHKTTTTAKSLVAALKQWFYVAP